MTHHGDAQRGRAVFRDASKANCAKCHSLDAAKPGAGPLLSAVGDKFDRQELINSILEPSSRIAVGYGNTIVQTDAGKAYAGVLQRVTDDWIELLDENSRRIRISGDEIVSQQPSEQSLMPEGIENAITPGEFVDLLAYLQSLKQASNASASFAAPNEIAPCRRPLQFSSFFSEEVHLERPLWLGQVPGSDSQYVILEHFGRVWLIEKRPEGDQQRLLLDLGAVIRRGGATGLLGMAFHPQFQENRKYYLKYQVLEGGRIFTIVDERQFAEHELANSGNDPRQLLKIPCVTQNHNGGCLEFGADGYLYIGMGDTGPQRDPRGHGQDLGTLLGKILRIDVDRSDADRPYAIPENNPFQDAPGAKPEIWAYGFREPWRFSFDRATNDFWVGDVGQDQYEEVAIVRAGENHGWNVFEGFAPFSSAFKKGGVTYTPPVMSYPRRLGISVTGGYVYRGRKAPAFEGRYLFGDFESRRIWALRHEDRVLTDVVEIGRCPTRVVSFAQDVDGEIYLVGYDDGVIYKLDLSKVDPTPLRTNVLAETSEHSPVAWRVTFAPPSDGWQDADYDDSSWQLAPGGFGTVGTPGAVVRTDWHSADIWLRRELSLPTHVRKRSKLALRIHHDEDAEVYVNGIELVRLASWTTGYVDVPLDAQGQKALRPGRNVLAIHCRQQSGGQYIDAGLVELVAWP
ncbi:MAG TPA: PQQ-dependent sugar dehydrogenase [Lacipirellula sp.]